MEIKEILTKQVELLQQMCLVLEKEYEILKNGNPQDILSLVDKKQELQQRLSDCEQKRLGQMGTTTLKEYEEQVGEEVVQLANQYKTLLPRMSELIELNKVLTEMGIRHCNGMIEIISSSAQEKVQTYGQRGYMSKKEVKTSAILNRQA